MKKNLMILAILTVTGFASFAQSSKVVTAMNALASGEYLKARDAIEIAAVHEKTSLEAKTWLYRGRIYNLIARDTTGQYSMVETPIDKAMESFRNALKMEDIKNWRDEVAEELYVTYNLYYIKGVTAYNAGDYESAYSFFSKASEANKLEIEADPKAMLDTAVIFNIGLTASETGRKSEAIDAFQKLVDLKWNDFNINNPEDHDGVSITYRELIDLYVDAGRIADAEKTIETGRKNFPGDKEIMTSELNFYINQGRLNELVAKLENAVKLDPENSNIYFVLGTTHGQLIDLDSANRDYHFAEAIKAYQKTLSMEPNRFEANLNIAALYYNSAIVINNGMAALPLDKQAEYDALQKKRNDLYTTALPYFEKAHQIDPKDKDTMIALREIYVRLGFPEKAEEIRKEMEG